MQRSTTSALTLVKYAIERKCKSQGQLHFVIEPF